MRIFRSRAPVRFCDLGGWTDTRLVSEGWVLNFAASLYTHVTLVVTGDGGVSIESCDTDEFERVRDIRELEYNNVLDLCKAAIKRSGAGNGIRLTVRSDAPPASGLGSSAALGVATMAAFDRWTGVRRLPYDTAMASQALEVEDLGLECGVQDQLAAAYGGVNFMHVRYPEATVFPLRLDTPTRCELEDRLCLVYTGKSHFSSAMHQKVIAAYELGETRTRRAFETLGRCAARGKDALLAGDLTAFAAAMNDNWAAQKDLHPEITTPQVDQLWETVARAGGIGFKLNGAGGGGTATILCERNRNHLVHRAVEAAGMHVLPTRIDDSGLCNWEVEAKR
jgi:D-glycero-alpha-D-manno-heptose-7-phosphate kinase